MPDYLEQLQQDPELLYENTNWMVENGVSTGDYFGATPQDNGFLVDVLAPGGMYNEGDISKAMANSVANMSTRLVSGMMRQASDYIAEDRQGILDAIKSYGDSDVSSVFEWVRNIGKAVPSTLDMITGKTHRDVLKKFFDTEPLEKMLLDSSKDLNDWTNRSLAEAGLMLDEGEQPTLTYNLVTGASSLMASLGIGVLTKSPKAAASVFGAIQQTQAYDAYIQAGTPSEKARAYASLEGFAVGYIEMLGMGQWLNTIMGRGGSVWRGAARGSIANFQEEFAQGGAEEFFRKMGGINDNNLLESFESMLGQGILGAMVGGPVGSVVGPMEMRGRNKMMEGAPFLEAVADTLVGRMSDDKRVELKMRLESQMDGAKSAAATEYAGLRDEIFSIIEAFNNGTPIEEVIKSAEGRDKIVEDILSRIDTDRSRTMAVERAGYKRQLRTKEMEVMEKMAALEDRGASLVEEIAESFKAETKYADIAEELQLLYDMNAGDPDFVADLEGWVSDVMGQELDEAQYEALIEELHNNQAFETILEGSDRYLNIQKKGAELGQQLSKIQAEIQGLESALDSDLEDIVGNEFVRVRGNVIEDIRKKQGVASFLKGLSIGKKFTKKEITEAQAALTKGIQEIRAGQVSEKAKQRILKLVRQVKNEEQLARAMQRVDEIILADNIKTARKKAEGKANGIVESIGKKVRSKQPHVKMDARITSLFQVMDNARREMSKRIKQEPFETKEEFVARKEATDLRNIDEYQEKLVKMASDAQDEAAPSQAGNIAQAYISSLIDPNMSLASKILLAKNLEALATTGRAAFMEAKMAVDEEVDSARGQIVQRSATKKKRRPKHLRERFSEALKQPGNYLLKTYNTMLHQFDIADVPVLAQMETLNMQNSSNRIKNDNRLLEIIKNTVGGKFFSGYHKEVVLDIDAIKIGKDRMLEYLDNELDFDEAKANVRRYINHRRGQKGFDETARAEMKDAVIAAEDFDGLMSLVNGMRQEHVGSWDIQWTRGQLINWYMLSQNDDVFESMMAPWGDMGMTPEIMNQINGAMTKQDIQLANTLFQEFEQMYFKVNDVYRRINGVELPRIQFYTPILRETADGDEMTHDPVNNGVHYMNPSLTKSRTSNAIRIKERDILDVYNQHMHNAQHYVDYAEWYAKAHAVVSDKDVRRALTNKHGSSAYKTLEAHIALMNRSHEQELGTRIASLNFFRKNFMLSTLGANPQIGVKQLTSILAFMESMPATDFVGYVNEFFENPKKNIELMRQHDTFLYRGQKWNNELDRITNDRKMQGKGKYSVADLMMLPTKLGDGFAVYVGGYAHMRHSMEQGMPQADALDLAARKAEASQQTSIEANLPVAQRQNNEFVKLLTMFTSSPIALMNMEMQAVYKYRNGDISFGDMSRRIAIYHVFIPAFFTWVASAFDADEEEYAKSFILGTSGSAPLYGGFLDLVATSVVNSASESLGRDSQLPVWRNNALADNPIYGAGDAFVSGLVGGEIKKAVQDAAEGKDPISIIEMFGAIAEATELLSVAPTENLTEMAEGAFQLFDDDPHKGALKILGFSDYTINQDD